MAKKSKKPRVSRVTLRVQPDVHARVVKVARLLGLDVNGVFNFMLSRWLGQMEVEAKAYKRFAEDDEEFFEAMREWMEANPGRRRKEFAQEYIRMLMGEPSSVSEDYDPISRPRPSLPDVSNPATIVSLLGEALSPQSLGAEEDGDDF